MHSIKIEIPNRQGFTLSGRLEMPPDKKAHAFAIIAHCFTCGKNFISLRHLSKSLTLQGIAVLRFDFTGIGESEGEFVGKGFNANIDDIVDVAEYLKKNYKAPSILIGHSLGGTAVLLAAAQLPDAKAIVTIGAPSNPEHVKKLFSHKIEDISEKGYAEVDLGGRSFNIGEKFVQELNTPHMKQVIKDLNKALLVLHSPQDKIVDISNAEEIYTAAMHPKSYISLDGADHLVTDKKDSAYIAEVTATWAKRYLVMPEEEPLRMAKRVAVRTGSSYTTEIRAGNHGLMADEPKQVGGNDLGPTPYDLLVAGLGSCTSITLRMYADRKKWDLEEVIVHLQHDKIHAEDCAECEDTSKGKIDVIERIIELRGELDEKQRERLLEIADKCPVHKTLTSDIHIRTSLKKE